MHQRMTGAQKRKFSDDSWRQRFSWLLLATDTARMLKQELTLLSIAGAEAVTYKW